MNTVDNASYYSRHDTAIKELVVRNFVVSKPAIESVHDVGCNAGHMSAQFIPLGKRISGVDLATDLTFPTGYHFRHADIVSDKTVVMADCILFLSLYHHILGAHGLEVADRIFYQLLLRSKYLVFDTGNLTESSRTQTNWYKVQAQYFKSEKELLDHFNIPYITIGSWSVAGGLRTIVVFEGKSFDMQAAVVDEFRRKYGSATQPEGLFKATPSVLKAEKMYYPFTQFCKLKLGNYLFFTKRHTSSEYNDRELRNIIDVYARLKPDKLITFYGQSKCYGVVYEWLNTLQYVGKCHTAVDGVMLKDSDIILVDGHQKYIDFFITDRW